MIPCSRSLRVSLMLALCAQLVLSGCKEDERKQAAPAAPPPPAVTVIKVAQGNIPLSYEYAGRVSGSREVEIRARVSGILLERAYQEGQSVEEGAVLFKIDPKPYEAEFANANARFNQAKRDWNRTTALKKDDAISAREYDQAQSAYEQAKAAVQTAEINLGYTTVTAPISGVTSSESLSEGSLVTADSSLLTRLTQLDPVYVYFSSPDMETLMQRREVSEGTLMMPADKKLHAEIRYGDGTAYSELGTIDFTDSIITPETGTVRARAVVPNKENRLLPGQFVRVMVKGLVRPNAIAIPDKAILQGPQGPFVYTVGEDGKAAVKPVKLGALNDNARLIESGLEAGERVITEGMIKVRPGSPVKIAPAAEGASKAP